MRQALYRFKRFILDLFVYPEMSSQNLSYDDYWKIKKKGTLGIPNNFQVERGRWIASRIDSGASVIDIGCGDGSVLFAIQCIKSIRASGGDISPFILDFIQKKGVSSFLIDLKDPNSLNDIPLHDHLLLLEILEHLGNPEDFLLKALTKVNKSVFISIPNTGYIKHRLRLMMGRFPLQWRSHPSEHLRFWTTKDFDWWLKALDLRKKTTVKYYAGIPYLNKLCPSLFSEGIMAEINKN